MLAARGDLERAILELQSSVDLYGNVLLFERARSVLALGEVRRRARHKRVARECLMEAQHAFASLGASIWAESAANEVARVGGRRTASGLTITEQRVAELVAQGRTNREVAAELFVTVKTVETTLSHIYTKLGVRTRVALANHLAKTGAIPGSNTRRRA